MKYIKTFERNTYDGGVYWLIPTEQVRYRTALKKIGCDDPDWYNLNYEVFGKYIFISKRNNVWEWSDDADYYDNLGYEYKGKVEIDEYEIDQNKYNL